MSIEWTFVWLALTAVITGFAVWRDGVPRENGKVHWVSWKPIMMIGVVIFIVLITHLLNVFGVETGQGRGRV